MDEFEIFLGELKGPCSVNKWVLNCFLAFSSRCHVIELFTAVLQDSRMIPKMVLSGKIVTEREEE